MIRRRHTSKEQLERINRERAAIEAAAFLFLKMAESGQLEQTAITAHAALIPMWEENTPHRVGCLRRCPICGDIFKCIDPPPVSERARNSRIPPSEAPRFWELVAAVNCAAEPCAADGRFD